MFGLFGMTCATMVYFVLSATGIASLIVASHTLFMVIKWFGVGYLLYLGLSAIFSKSGGISVRKTKAHQSRKKLFSTGFFIEFSNPKALLYFSSILPQFLDVTQPLAMQFAIMWVMTFLLQWVIYIGYAFMGARLVSGGIKQWCITLINKTAGAALIFAGVKMMSVTNLK
jgi:threonine/homoserine/homoserine lactone efflux protein